MVKIFALVFINQSTDTPHITLHSKSLFWIDPFGFNRSNVLKEIEKIARMSLDVTQNNQFHTLLYKEYMCHNYINSEYKCCVMTDADYPKEVAYEIIFECVRKFGVGINTDLTEYIDQAQNPENVKKLNKLHQINQQIDQTREIVITNLELLIERGDKLEDLEDRSKKLVDGTDAFKKEAERLNQCCVIL